MRVGIDIIEVERIKRSMKNSRFLSKVFSREELELFEQRRYNPETIAGRFCVKEAFGKALGIGVREFELNEVATLNDELGAPYIVLKGKALEIAGDKNISVSISHTKEYATAIVIIY
ncbi:MAG: holo-ACP synthase [Clostridiales bacterium]|mgnify:FL=1|jgi:holo-[acyl-carrier protein] synthase|nr:holo-ACP synthase [Clostridiales bacterium]